MRATPFVMGVFVLMMSMVLTASAQAESWIEISAGADGKFRQYLDVDSIERNLGNVELWEVIDYANEVPKVNGKSAASQRIQLEFDCPARAMRQRYVGWHAAGMGKGQLLKEEADAEWQIDSFDALTLPLWQIACEGLSPPRQTPKRQS